MIESLQFDAPTGTSCPAGSVEMPSPVPADVEDDESRRLAAAAERVINLANQLKPSQADVDQWRVKSDQAVSIHVCTVQLGYIGSQRTAKFIRYIRGNLFCTIDIEKLSDITESDICELYYTNFFFIRN